MNAKRITMTYYGFQGSGATVKEAKEDAGRKIAALQDGSWSLTLREWRGHAAIVHRTLYGWEYTFISHPGEPLHLGGSCLCGIDSREDVIRQVERHIADIGWQIDTDAIDVFPEWLTNERDRADVLDRRKWQTAVQFLIKQGMPSHIACDVVGGRFDIPEGFSLEGCEHKPSYL